MYKRGNDFGDWMVVKEEFDYIMAEVEREFGARLTLDGASDPVGSNRQLPRYCLLLYSVLYTDLRGGHLYINPDFDDIESVLKWFLK